MDKTKFKALLVATLLAFGANAQAVTVVGSNVWSGNGHTYSLIAGGGSTAPTGLTWSDAESYASTTLGGHLATVDSVALKDWLWSLYGAGANRNLWIGLTDQVTEGNYTWIASGQTTQYTNWYPGEPNNYGNEDYVFILRSGFVGGSGAGENTWNDGQNSWTAFFDAPIFAIAETSPSTSTVPEPTSMLLLGIGLVGIALRRKQV